METTSLNVFPFVIPVVSVIAVFTFLSVVEFVEGRRREREALYRSELLKKVVDTPGPGAEQVVALLREEDERLQRRKREKLLLTGMIWLVIGVGLTALLANIPDARAEGVWVAGLIPLLIGAAVLVHAVFVVRKG